MEDYMKARLVAVADNLLNAHGKVLDKKLCKTAIINALGRVRRSWIDRLKGYYRLYEDQVTDGERAAYGRGASREASEQAALRNWNNTSTRENRNNATWPRCLPRMNSPYSQQDRKSAKSERERCIENAVEAR